MENIPTELWAYIFSLACTDGGLAGCSLSLVSRYFHEAVLPVQLYSVALLSPAKMTSFAALLKKRPAEYCRVRHLLLSRSGVRDIDARVPMYSHSQVTEVLHYILVAVAPHLFTLASTLAQGSISSDKVLSVSFPALVELTVHGYLYPGDDAETALSGSFPSLRYLHILSACDSCPVYLRRAPSLSHLRLSSVAKMEQPLRTSLLDFLSGVTRSDQPSMFPPTLHRVVIERYASRLMRYVVNGNPTRFTDADRDELSDADKSRKLVIIDERLSVEGAAKLSPGSVRYFWEQRIVGGLGCWTEGSNVPRKTQETPSVGGLV